MQIQLINWPRFDKEPLSIRRLQYSVSRFLILSREHITLLWDIRFVCILCCRLGDQNFSKMNSNSSNYTVAIRSVQWS